MAVCSAITHNGSRCASPAADDGSGVCSHHARMARLLALAPKTSDAPVAAPIAAANGVHAPVVPARPASFDMKNTQRELYSIQKQSQSVRGGSQSADTIASAFTPKQAASVPLGMAMLPNEGVLAAVNSSFMFPTTVGLPAIPGTLFVTNYRLRFEPIQAALRSPGHFHPLLDDALVGIPRACVGKLTYPQVANATRSKYESAVPTQLVIKFKDLRAWTLGGDINTLMMTLNRHVFIDSPLSLFAFTAGISPAHAHRELQGHQIYNLVADFARMGVNLVNGPFRVTEMNANYAMCPTYPPQIVVPASMSDHEIANVAEFRSKGRLPICCFVHPRNSASIWRCAQPKRGILNAQNPADDRYLAYIGYSNRHQKKIWIADCRPELNARVNKLTGGGTESSSLQHASVSFLNIANIHAMRDSIESIRALVVTGNADLDFVWNTRVEDTKWLSHVRLVLSAAIRVAEAVGNKGTTVLVHCSDGWDRTGQLCALSQMLLDKHYRTIVGFMEVIEKEWVRVGHKFHDRVGPGRSEHEEQSPVFLQFLDCVWQLWRQYPTYFEFNGKLLECIADAIFSGRYGTFLGNCDRERKAWSLQTRTASLWTHVLDHKATYQNPFYRPQTETTLLPPVSSVLRQVTLWSEYYFRSATLPATPVGNPCPPVPEASSIITIILINKMHRWPRIPHQPCLRLQFCHHHQSQSPS
uniref:Uncharacterized protein n=1 Tax=Globisporangium ultimum (strain ATCC 200006 / CBS 805.95 / DAOM BR144) TaxID=431595 RepID=K3X024_GLOUD